MCSFVLWIPFLSALQTSSSPLSSLAHSFSEETYNLLASAFLVTIIHLSHLSEFLPSVLFRARGFINHFNHTCTPNSLLDWIVSKDSYIHSTEYLGLTYYVPDSSGTMVNKIMRDPHQERTLPNVQLIQRTVDEERGRGESQDTWRLARGL